MFYELHRAIDISVKALDLFALFFVFSSCTHSTQGTTLVLTYLLDLLICFLLIILLSRASRGRVQQPGLPKTKHFRPKTKHFRRLLPKASIGLPPQAKATHRVAQPRLDPRLPRQRFFALWQWLYHRIHPNSAARKPREKRNRPSRVCPSALPVSVAYSAANVNPSFLLLSVVTIPTRWRNPRHQRDAKQTQRTRIPPPWKIKQLLLLVTGLSLFQNVQLAHSLPGTNHNLIRGERSLDRVRQQRLVRTAIANVAGNNADVSPPVVDAKVSEGAPSDIRRHPHVFVADTDSTTYVLDTGANRFIINDPKLLSNYRSCTGEVKGIGGKTTAIKGVGSFRLNLETHDRSVHSVRINDAVCVPTSSYNLVPPQLLVTKLREQGYSVNYFKHDNEEYIIEYRDRQGNKHRIACPISDNQLFLLRTKSGYKCFMSEAPKHDQEWCMFAGAAMVSDDEDSESEDEEVEDVTPVRPTTDAPREGKNDLHQTPREPVNREPATHEIPDLEPPAKRPKHSEFDLSEKEHSSESPELAEVRRKQNRLMTYHERLGHAPFSILRLLASSNLIPRELKNVDPPSCPGCAYGKQNRKQWRHKGIKNKKRIRPATRPGEVVSVDQLVSPTPGFIPQRRGIHSTARYLGATVFVDHHSDFTYVHMMVGHPNGKTTVEAKNAFERVAAEHGVKVNHYHADNGLFDSNEFKDDIRKCGQTLSFCGVNAHHQNGKAESRIKDVTAGARTALLHAAHRWPKAIHASLWPAAMKNYVNLRNALPRKFIQGNRVGRKQLPSAYVDSPISLFSGTAVEPNLDHFHPFGSPVYVLEDKLQAQHAHNKWSDRSKVGIYLSHSPHHASNVPLILNTQTGHVTPQFHCVYDDAFATCKRDAKFQSLWQVKAKLDLHERQYNSGRKILHTTRSNQTPVAYDPTKDPIGVPFRHAFVPSDIANQQSAATAPRPPTESQSPRDSQLNTEDEEQQEEHTPGVTTRSGRNVRPPARFSQLACVESYLSSFSSHVYQEQELSWFDTTQENEEEAHPLAFFVSECFGMVGNKQRDPDTMTLQEAMRQPDKAEFVKAMYKELNDHIERKHWKA